MPATSLPPDLERQLQGELDTGENLLWAGQPIPARMARLARPALLAGIPLTLFALLWEGLALFGVISTLTPTAKHSVPHLPVLLAPLIFPLVGAVFLAGAVGTLMTPWQQRQKAARIAYAVTNRRVLIVDASNLSFQVQTVSPQQARNSLRTQNADGSGDLVFHLAGTWSMQGRLAGLIHGLEGKRSVSGQLVSLSIGFYGIPDVKAVDELIRHTFEK